MALLFAPGCELLQVEMGSQAAYRENGASSHQPPAQVLLRQTRELGCPGHPSLRPAPPPSARSQELHRKKVNFVSHHCSHMRGLTKTHPTS